VTGISSKAIFKSLHSTVDNINGGIEHVSLKLIGRFDARSRHNDL